MTKTSTKTQPKAPAADPGKTSSDSAGPAPATPKGKIGTVVVG